MKRLLKGVFFTLSLSQFFGPVMAKPKMGEAKVPSVNYNVCGSFNSENGVCAESFVKFADKLISGKTNPPRNISAIDSDHALSNAMPFLKGLSEKDSKTIDRKTNDSSIREELQKAENRLGLASGENNLKFAFNLSVQTEPSGQNKLVINVTVVDQSSDTTLRTASLLKASPMEISAEKMAELLAKGLINVLRNLEQADAPTNTAGNAATPPSSAPDPHLNQSDRAPLTGTSTPTSTSTKTPGNGPGKGNGGAAKLQ